MRFVRSRAVLAPLVAVALAAAAACSNTGADPSVGDTATVGSANAGATGTGQPGTSNGGANQSNAPGAFDASAITVAGAAVTPDDLARAGITVVADDRAPVAEGTFTFSGIQVERMLTEQAVGGGLLGSDIDQIAPMPEDLPPTSYLLQAWIAKGTSGAADAARAAMGSAAQATTGIENIVYPSAVVALFVADLGAMISEATPDGLRGNSRAFSDRTRGISTPCSAANTFITQTIKGVFDFLRLDVPARGGVFGAVIGVLANIWNHAVELARNVVQTVVGAITEQIFSKIRIVAAGLGAASILISYLKGQQLVVTVEPQFTRVAAGSEPDIPGRYIARAHPLSELWPPALMDCVTVAGGKMPELMLPGASARWQLTDPPSRAGLVVPAQLTTTVAADHRAYLDFVTGREPAEWAKGPESADGPIVTVEVEQKGITDFLRETKDSLLGDLKASILSIIPIAKVREALTSVISLVLDPIAGRIEAELNSRVGGMFTLTGHAEPIMVTYHNKPDDPDPEPNAPPPGGQQSDAFCDKIRDLVAWGNANWERLDLEPFSAEILRRLVDARTVAPPQMIAPVDAGIPVYEAGASGSSLAFAALGLDGLKAWGEAAPKMLGYCHIPVEEWPQMPDE